MAMRNFYDVIRSMMSENIYSIQLNLALVPQDAKIFSHENLSIRHWGLPINYKWHAIVCTQKSYAWCQSN